MGVLVDRKVADDRGAFADHRVDAHLAAMQFDKGAYQRQAEAGAALLLGGAIGNLIDPIQYALPLPFVHPDGRHASRDEIASEWLRVKNDANLAKYGHRAAKLVTSLRLTEQGVADLVARKLEQNARHLAARFLAEHEFAYGSRFLGQPVGRVARPLPTLE